MVVAVAAIAAATRCQEPTPKSKILEFSHGGGGASKVNLGEKISTGFWL